MKPENNTKMYKNFYDCLCDVQTVLGISRLKDMPIAIKFAEQSGFPDVAEYFRRETKRLEWNVKKEYENVDNSNINFST